MSIVLSGTNFSENWIGILSFSFKKMHLKMSSARMVAILSRGRWVKQYTAYKTHWPLWYLNEIWLSNFQANFSDRWLRYLLLNCHQVIVTGPYWWYVNIGSILVQVMAWCHKAVSHHLSQSWPSSRSVYGWNELIVSQWVMTVSLMGIWLSNHSQISTQVLVSSQKYDYVSLAKYDFINIM